MDIFELALLAHKEHVRDSEKRQLYQQNASDIPPFRTRLLLRFGNLLSAIVALFWGRL